MPFQKTFRILLEEDNTDGSILDSIGGASFLSLNGTDTSGAMNADSLVLGTDESQSESKPTWLSEDADGSGDYAKEDALQQIVVGYSHQVNLTLEVIIVHLNQK